MTESIIHADAVPEGFNDSRINSQATGACMCDDNAECDQLLSIEQAQQTALGLVKYPVETETVPINDALGRIVAENIAAPRPMPFFNNSAMDGFAIRTANLSNKGPHRLAVRGESAAGVWNGQQFDLSCALRVNTGALVPAGFDCVIPHENCRNVEGCIEFDTIPANGANIRYQGSDIAGGAPLITNGTVVQPHLVGLLAANGFPAIEVYRRPRMAVVSTGDELARPGQTLKTGQVFDCNKPMLAALFSSLGLKVADLGTLPDDPEATRDFFAEQRNKFDLIVSTGSVSFGNRDFLKPSFEAAGGSIKSWRVAVKPGKPVMFGTLGQTLLTALPGNPFAVFVGFSLFVKPQIARLSGWTGGLPRWQSGRADFTWRRKAGRAEVFPVAQTGDQSNGAVLLNRLGNSVSATLYPLSEADGLAIVSSDCGSVRQGDRIHWQPFC